MKKNHTFIGILLAAVTLSGCVYANKPKSLPPGQYERSSTTVDSKGTARSTESSTSVYYDKYGNKKSTIDTKASTDPKGLFNKSTTETHSTVK